jgi:magnesium-transporting ATPase (P-type)
MEKIQKHSRTIKIIGRLVFWAAIASTIIFPLLIMLSSSPDTQFSLNETEFDLQSMDTGNRVTLSLISVLASLVLAYGAYHFYKLFGLYEKGIIFAKENVQHISAIGKALLCWFLAELLIDYGTITLSEFAKGPTGINLDLSSLLIGATIFLFARVMDEGRKLREEQELIV